MCEALAAQLDNNHAYDSLDVLVPYAKSCVVDGTTYNVAFLFFAGLLQVSEMISIHLYGEGESSSSSVEQKLFGVCLDAKRACMPRFGPIGLRSWGNRQGHLKDLVDG